MLTIKILPWLLHSQLQLALKANGIRVLAVPPRSLSQRSLFAVRYQDFRWKLPQATTLRLTNWAGDVQSAARLTSAAAHFCKHRSRQSV